MMRPRVVIGGSMRRKHQQFLSRISRSKLAGVVSAVALVAVATIATVWGLTLAQLKHDHDAATLQATNDSASLVVGLEENVLTTLRGVSQTMGYARRQYVR